MKGRSKKYYRKIFRAYPDMVTLLQFREMLGGVSDNFARKLIHEKHVTRRPAAILSEIFSSPMNSYGWTSLSAL